MQVIPGTSTRAHVSPKSGGHPELSTYAPPILPAVTQEASDGDEGGIPPRAKDPHAALSREERFQDVLPVPFVRRFLWQGGASQYYRGYEEPGQERADKAEGADPWEHYSGVPGSQRGVGDAKYGD